METIKIYSLEDPLTKEIRYVGKTKDTLEKRFSTGHMFAIHREKSYKRNWLKSLENKGLQPTITLLDEIPSTEDWEWLEKYWISQIKSWGFRLTNMTEGGEGNKNQVFSKESIEKRASKLRGRKYSKEHCAKISKALKGKVKSKQHIMDLTATVRRKQAKKILQYDFKGNFIKEWPSIREAAKNMKVDKTSLSRAVRGLWTHSAGYKWKIKI